MTYGDDMVPPGAAQDPRAPFAPVNEDEALGTCRYCGELVWPEDPTPPCRENSESCEVEEDG